MENLRRSEMDERSLEELLLDPTVDLRDIIIKSFAESVKQDLDDLIIDEEIEDGNG